MAKEGRVFLRGMSSEQYGLKEFRQAQLSAPRVRGDEYVADDATVGHSGDSKDSRTWWRIGPGDDPFLTQNIQVHFVEIPAGKANHGHGHQNEAAFYILQGSGYEIHDDTKYPWSKDDFVVVHTDSVHRHFNDGDETAKALVMKAKSTWMYFQLIQQGRSGPVAEEDRFGPREDWSQIWTDGVEDKVKVVKPADTVFDFARREEAIVRQARTKSRVVCRSPWLQGRWRRQVADYDASARARPQRGVSQAVPSSAPSSVVCSQLAQASSSQSPSRTSAR
jgi:quercetin dioxygenase-like cupin family protein